MLFKFHNSFTFFLPAIPFPIHPAKQTVHFSPESLKPSIHTVCLEKQNRYLVDPKSFHRKLFDPADGLISHMEDHFIVLEQVDRLAQGELKELTSLLQNREGGLLAAVINEASQEASVQNAAAGFFPAQIRLPALSEWSLSDRLNLIRRNFVFRSKGNLAKQIGWYVLAFCIITCIVNSINCIWVAVAGLLVPDFIYNIGTTVLNGGISMVIFFFVNKIIFPEGEKAAK